VPWLESTTNCKARSALPWACMRKKEIARLVGKEYGFFQIARVAFDFPQAPPPMNPPDSRLFDAFLASERWSVGALERFNYT